MKLCIFADPHWSEYSSILRMNGERHTTRLENLIKSTNFVLDVALKYGCESIVCLGDFFDTANISSQTITALSEIDFSRTNMPLAFIVGNHEMASSNLFYNSSNIFNIVDNSHTISSPNVFYTDNSEIWFLPYILESDRKSLESYLKPKTKNNRIILSHNDIAGIQMGAWKSEAGFSIEEIENNCDLFINGHLHNGDWITRKILNLGNLTGQNFSEDALKYNHYCLVLDSETLEVTFIENPYAFNFYKIDLTKNDNLPVFKNNAVVSLTCKEADYLNLKKALDENEKIITYRLIIQRDTLDPAETEDLITFNSTDHIDKFRQYVLNNIGNTDLIQQELNEILS